MKLEERLKQTMNIYIPKVKMGACREQVGWPQVPSKRPSPLGQSCNTMSIVLR